MTAGIWTGSGLRFTGFGHYYPRSLVRNAGLADAPENAVDRAVLGSIAVRSRHVAAEDETIEFMAEQAAVAALRRAGREAEEVDLVVLSNWSERQFVPELAPMVASRLAATRALAFDVCGACTGFVHGVQTAAAMLTAHRNWRTAVVVSSEYFSRRVRPGSRGELVVGDAAGAVVIEKGDVDRVGLIDTLLVSDAARAETVTVRPPFGWIKSKPELVEVAVTSNTDACLRLLERNDMKIGDVDWYVPHPGTGPIHDGVRERLGIAAEKFITNFETRANTGSASIPIVLSEYIESDVFRAGDRVLSSAVGSGWYFGGLIFEL